MARTKKLPSNTVTSLVETMAAALAGDIEPPDHVKLRPGDRPYWIAVMRTRARSEWTPADLIHAGNLARCMADVERISAEVQSEGDIIENARGTPIPNPKHTLLKELSNRAITLTRLMQMQGVASGRAADKQAQRKQEASARETAGQVVGEDDLIPS